MEGSSLIDVGGLAKPATVLIEKISEAIGVVAAPWQIKRVAEAEAQAKIIMAKTELGIDELRQRALTRFVQEETKKQQNIESITEKAIPLLSENSTPRKIDNDWMMHFFDKCKIVSDDEMQNMWAKILAGEANSPGKYSKRTIEILSMLNKDEANIFSLVCSFSLEIQEESPHQLQPLIYDYKDKYYADKHLIFGSLIHLANIGLICMAELGSYERTEFPKKILLLYRDEKIQIEFPLENNNKLDVGSVIFTQAGQELSRVCVAEKAVGFLDYLIKTLELKGLRVQKIITQ
jgi:uncharacterized repeat protein (TIGR03899 family)